MTTLTAAHLLTVARSKLGVWVEHPDGSNHVPDVTDVYGIDPGPWCAMGVSRIFALAGDVTLVAFSTSRGFAYCPSGIAGFRARGEWHGGTSGIAAGDVIFFDWEGDGVSDHVGIVEYVDANGIHTIECNSDNRCERRLRNANIVGYGRPKYATPTPPTPHPTPTPRPTWKEIDPMKLQRSYVQVPIGSNGAGVFDLGAKVEVVGLVSDIAPHAGLSITAPVTSSGHTAIAVAGAPAGGEIGVRVTTVSA